jgi:hydroxyethylthiazole kinase-like uncharacterized protein yjeF
MDRQAPPCVGASPVSLSSPQLPAAIPTYPCYRVAGMRSVDRLSAEGQRLSEYELMCKAGEAAFTTLLTHWPTAKRLLVVCGTGNNGGDGWVLAHLAEAAGLRCDVAMVGDLGKLQGAARQAFEAWRSDSKQAVGSIDDFLDAASSGQQIDVVVDAMIGIGLSSALRTESRDVIDNINALRRPVLALDVPSGINADTGVSMGAVIRADVTVTFIALKPGLVTGPALDCVGKVLLETLDTPESAYAQVAIDAWVMGTARSNWMQPRNRAAHKGRFGHVLVIGGDTGMGGAALLAAGAALRSGAGLVSLATRQAHVVAALARYPEVMVTGVDDSRRLDAHLSGKQALVVGPGLGREQWGLGCLQQALCSKTPLVIDADALNIVASGTGDGTLSERCVLTPHPGEAGRLAGVTAAAIESDRLSWAERLAQKTGAVVVLKGAGTIIAFPGRNQPSIIGTGGNPGMATGGMGDVLAGLIGGLMAQGLEPALATVTAVGAHAAAGDVAWDSAGVGLTASDVIANLGAVLTASYSGSS